MNIKVELYIFTLFITEHTFILCGSGSKHFMAHEQF